MARLNALTSLSGQSFRATYGSNRARRSTQLSRPFHSTPPPTPPDPATGSRVRTPLPDARSSSPFKKIFNKLTLPAYTGSAPYHRALLLLHTATHISQFPPRPTSALIKALLMVGVKHRADTLVNFAYFGPGGHASGLPAGDRDQGGEGEPPELSADALQATAYVLGQGRVDLGLVSLDGAERTIQTLLQLQDIDAPGARPPNLTAPPTIDLLVCTHGSRDCRCGDVGGPVAAALRAEVVRRGVEGRVRVCEVTHIGGHKWAANVLVYPSGDWLGNLTAEDIPEVLTAILAHHDRPAKELLDSWSSDPPLCASHWRGRWGMDKESQQELATRG